MKKTDAEQQKEAVIIDIEKSVGPRKSFLPPKRADFDSSDSFDRDILDTDDEIVAPHWSIPWSDIMMVVFVMFAVLFICSVSKRNTAEASKIPPETKTVIPRHQSTPAVIAPEQLRAWSNRLARDTKPGEVTVVIEKNRFIKVSANDSLFFDAGKAVIKPEGIRFLRDFAAIVETTKSNIQIEGHTDSFPIHSSEFPTNWELSAIRAVNIARFLIEETGLAPERFSVVGHSMYRPAVPNSTTENKAKNRRVEIFIENG